MRRKRRLSLAITVVLSAVLLVSSAGRGLALTRDEPHRPSIPDGEWIGSWALVGSYTIDGKTVVTGQWFGDLDFTVQAGAVEGIWTIEGSGEVVNEGVSGSATFAGEGVMGGLSDAPTMAVKNIAVNYEVSVSGITVSDVANTGPGDPFEMPIVSATCNQAVGDMLAAALRNLERTGASVSTSLTGSWVATRVGGLSVDDPTLYNREIGDLFFEVEDYKAQVLQGMPVTWDDLDGMMRRAESLMRSVKQGACGTTGRGVYLLPITQIVYDIVEFAFDNPAAFGNEDLGRLVVAAARVGLIGPGAADQGKAIEVEAEFIQLFTQRLAEARENDDCYEAIDIAVGITSLENGELSQQARDTVFDLCGDL